MGGWHCRQRKEIKYHPLEGEVTDMNGSNVYGNRIIVTGASSGIGRACALKFALNGCQVIGVSRHTEERTDVFPGGGSLTMKRLDVTDETASARFVDEVSQALGGIDIAILCAGMGVAGPAETTPQEMTRSQMEVNYFGTLNVAQPCLTTMRNQRKGLLLVIGSIAGRVSIPMQSQYSSSKYALEAFTDAVRMEMRRFGVRASIIEPGDTNTGFTAARQTEEN
ncbi:MAG: SDR family NAD(P)-dependent oxidoreductase, partial [Bacillota bacterium]|nr:SDR family NAD(P)-dependent oxidoreductase [Bacillota bacterium]